MNISFNKKTGLTLIIVALLVMGGIYVYQVNDLVQNVYLRDEHHQRLTKLQEELKRSEVAISQDHSLVQVDEVIEDKGFEAVDQISYIQLTDTQVAAIQ